MRESGESEFRVSFPADFLKRHYNTEKGIKSVSYLHFSNCMIICYLEYEFFSCLVSFLCIERFFIFSDSLR
jgi:hypothetical protein